MTNKVIKYVAGAAGGLALSLTAAAGAFAQDSGNRTGGCTPGPCTGGGGSVTENHNANANANRANASNGMSVGGSYGLSVDLQDLPQHLALALLEFRARQEGITAQVVRTDQESFLFGLWMDADSQGGIFDLPPGVSPVFNEHGEIVDLAAAADNVVAQATLDLIMTRANAYLMMGNADAVHDMARSGNCRAETMVLTEYGQNTSVAVPAGACGGDRGYRGVITSTGGGNPQGTGNIVTRTALTAEPQG